MALSAESVTALEAGYSHVARQRDIFAEALKQIAAGEGYYGAQAREYKQIAKAALAKAGAA